MLPSEFPEIQGHHALRRMFEGQIDAQFADVRTLLVLPREPGDAGCNFAAAAVLFNLIAGASVVLYNTSVRALTRGRDRGKRFKGLLEQFYPWTGEPMPAAAGADALYLFARNPLAHALGLDSPSPGRVAVLTKRPLTAGEIQELENSPTRPSWTPVTIDQTVLSDGIKQTAISVPTLYWGVHRMYRTLLSDANQIQSAVGVAEAFRRNWDKEAKDEGHVMEEAVVVQNCGICDSRLVTPDQGKTWQCPNCSLP